MLPRQLHPDIGNDAGVMLRARHDIENLFLRSFRRHHQLGGTLSVKLLHIGLAHSKQRYGVGRDRLEGAAGNQAKVIEERAVDHRHENALAHVLNHRAEKDRWKRLDLQPAQELWIRVVRVLDDRRVGPGRDTVPAMTDDPNSAESIANWLDRVENGFHRTPSKP